MMPLVISRTFGCTVAANPSHLWSQESCHYVTRAHMNNCMYFYPNVYHIYFKRVFSRESDSTITNVCPSVRSSVCHKAKPFNSLKSSSFIHPSLFFIILHSSFLHFVTFKLFSLFFALGLYGSNLILKE